MAYGISREAARVIEKVCKAVGAEFFPTSCLTDLLAVPHILLICDFSALKKGELQKQYGYMCEVADDDFAWILVGAQAMKPPRRLLSATIMVSEPLEVKDLKVILLRHKTAIRRRRQKAHLYDKRLHRLLFALKQLRTEHIAKTSDLCRELDVNRRTIARDMQILQHIGELIEYDQSAKAYRYYGDEIWPTGR